MVYTAGNMAMYGAQKDALAENESFTHTMNHRDIRIVKLTEKSHGK